MKHDVTWLNQLVPVLDNPGLPIIWAVAVTTDICMKEMGIGNDPGLIILGKEF
jgi:hypothetical protein